ncbi:unnamed protein product [Brassica rapa subsp. trilocularis]
MSLFRRFFYKNPPDHLVEISERVYAFDCCFSSDVMGENEYRLYLDGIVGQLQDHFPDASFLVFNFREGDQRSQISDALSQHDMTVMDYPNHCQNCPVLTLEMIHHFLKSSESWLSLEGQQNVLLMHCQKGGWPVLAFMLSGLLLYRKQYQGEQKTLEMVHKQAPKELLQILSPLNPQPSQLRYLQYISRVDWPPSDTPLLLDCLILSDLPHFEGRKGCRPVLRVYGQDPDAGPNRSSMLLFSTPKTNTHTRLYQQEECTLVKLDIQCRVQGDVVLECIHLHDDLVREEILFRIMFHTAFVHGNALIVQRDEMDILWDAEDQFPKEFKAEVLFSGSDLVVPTIATSSMSDDKDSFVVLDDSEATSVLHSSQAAESPPPLAYYSLGHLQTSQISSPPFSYVMGNSRTMLPPPSLPPPPPPPLYFSSLNTTKAMRSASRKAHPPHQMHGPPSPPPPPPTRGLAPIPPVCEPFVGPPPPPPSILGGTGAAVDPKGSGLLRPMYGAPTPPPPPPMRGR